VLDVRDATFELRASDGDTLKLALSDSGEGVAQESAATDLSPVKM